MARYSKNEAISERRSEYNIPIKHEHLGPRKSRLCAGGTLRIRSVSLSDYQNGLEVKAVCPGCGCIDLIKNTTQK